MTKLPHHFDYARLGALSLLAALVTLALLNITLSSLPTWIDHFLVAAAIVGGLVVVVWESKNRREENAIARLQDLYDNAPCGYHSLDANGVFIEINQTELDWLGYTRDEVIGKMKMMDLFDADGKEQFRSSFPKFMETGSVQELPFELRCKDGALRSVLVSSNAIYDKKGNFQNSRTTVFDIGLRKKLEKEIQAAQKAAAQAEAQIRDLYDYAPCGYHSTHANGFIIEINQTELDWLGYNRDEVVGKMKIFDIIDEAGKALFHEKLPEFIRTGFANELSIDLISKDGTHRPVLVSAIARYDENGEFHSSRATLFDISERKKLETGLRAAQESAARADAKIRDLYEHAPCGYHSTNANGFIIEINQTELDWLGYTRDEVVWKMKVFDLTDEEGKALFQSVYPEFIKNGFVKELSFNLIGKDGTPRPMLISSIARFEENGDFRSSRATVFDISKRKQLETDLRAAQASAERARIAKEHFLANMSHEIRTPLNAVIGFTGVLEKSELSEQQKLCVESIRGAGENLLTIIDDILDLSKLEAGMFRIVAIPFSLQGLLHSVDTMLQGRAEEKKLRLDIQKEVDMPDYLLGDPTRLTQILINLVGNAIKFTENGSVTVRAKAVEHHTDSLIVQFSVQDTGIGIPSSKLDTIFDRFEQAESDTSRLYGGTGLGLSITKRLVDLQGGSIYVVSELGQGSEFVFTLPYKLAELEAPYENGNGHHQHTVTKPVLEHRKPNGGFRILVVEDNLVNRKLAEILLKGWGMEHEFAENGEKGLEKLRSQKYDLVLMDIQMPKMDGYEAAKAIRNELKSTVPIIAMTAHALPGEREKCVALGMNDYIAKPLREAILLDLIHKYMD